ncbi:hypothetical protein [Paenibacillus oceani]|uniref:Pectate lyase superfamily protein domain-containing protein n=1 Tax=Paenibacillus oceani TaxID=2772510 RepID=A0A927CCZ2_9BACL|nr:hypothetical protein [Paenibacillus oceani]MBD2864398.1 hypothetical protein [Paenibacillus oceani]
MSTNGQQDSTPTSAAKMSRRKLIASIGLTGMALATGGNVTQALGDPPQGSPGGTNNGVSGKGGTMRKRNGNRFLTATVTADTIDDLRDLAGVSDGDTVMITSGGRAGLFRWDSGDRSADCANDPLMGMYVPLNGNNGSGGAFIRILDSEITPQMFGASGDGTGDDSGAINAFFAAINTFGLRSGKCVGHFRVGAPLVAQLGAYKGLTMDATFTSSFADEGYMLSITNSYRLNIVGKLALIGNGSTIATRTNGKGLLLDGVFQGSITKIDVRQFQHNGIEIRNNTGFSSFLRIGEVLTYLCGSAKVTGSNGISANWSNRIDAGGSSLPNQRSTITVDTLPPILDITDYVSINGNPYAVTNVDRSAMTLSVYPWIDIGLNAGTLDYFVGSGIFIRGGDSSGVSFGTLNTSACGIGANIWALYPGEVQYFSNESCGIGYILGRAPDFATVGGGIGTHYCENCAVNFLKASVYGQGSFRIDSTVDQAQGSKHRALSPRDTMGAFSERYLLMSGLRMGAAYGYETEAMQSASAPAGFSTLLLRLGGGGYPVHSIRKDSATIRLQDVSGLRTGFGHNQMFLYASGTSATGAPAGTLTFQPQDSGYTVNGSGAAAFSNLAGPTMFHCYLSGTAWVVQQAGGPVFKAVQAVTSVSVAAGDSHTVDVSVSGAAMGDFTQSSYSVHIEKLLMSSAVSAPGTVRLSFYNPSSSAVTLPAGTAHIRISR